MVVKRVIEDTQEIRKFLNRPPNMLDYIIIEKIGESVPVDEKEYYDLISSSKRAGEFIDIINVLKENGEAKKIEDLLIQDNVLYALEHLEPYRNKYKNELNISDSDKLIKWVKENINTSEDLEHLPSLTNEDIRDPKLYPFGWWITNKTPVKVFQSGGSTGKPTYTPYSNIDYETYSLIGSRGLKEYVDAREKDKALLLVPSNPHIYGPLISDCINKLKAIPIWKHFRNFSTEQILDQIKEVNPDILIAAPHGPKGAAGALDILLKTDQERGTDILPTYLKDKKIISGGAPISKELVEELYEDISVERIVNAYGATQIIGYFGKLNNKKRDDGIEFFSEVDIPTGYWIVTPIEDKEAPGGWSRYGITVLGREVMPIIKFDLDDYGKVDLKNRKIKDICRKDWFYQEKDGSYKVKIPSQVYTCISEV